MNVQNDGNLVVYNAWNQPLWNLGIDPSPIGSDRPSKVGDVVARDMDKAPFGVLGHLGMFDGERIVHVVPTSSQQRNAVQFLTYEQFKGDHIPWPTARPDVPSYAVYGCFSAAFCDGSAGTRFTRPSVSSRQALVMRARQVSILGADYTITAALTRTARPADHLGPAIRGVYRCDTFVRDIFLDAVGTTNWGFPTPLAWQTKMMRLSSPFALITPATTLEALR